MPERKRFFCIDVFPYTHFADFKNNLDNTFTWEHWLKRNIGWKEKGYHLRLNQTQMQFTNPTEASPAKEQISIIPLALPLNWLRWRLKKFPLKRWQSCDKSIKSGRIASAGWEGCWVSERVPPLEVQAAESWLMGVERPSAPSPPPDSSPPPPPPPFNF